MANPHNGHDTLADELWLQDFLSDNNTRLLYEIPATITGIESHCKKKIRWSVEEVLKLILGVLRTTPKPGGQKRWKEIAKKYFKGERTEEKLKQKWKDLKKHATKKTDGEQRLLYMMAAIVEVKLQSDKQEVFENVIQEWNVSLERANLATEAKGWLNEVENLELKQQLNEIKGTVALAEQLRNYDNIPYWSSQVHP